MRGNMTSKWPDTMNEFSKELNALPWNAFYTDSPSIYSEFTDNIKKAIESNILKLKDKERKDRDHFLEIVKK